MNSSPFDKIKRMKRWQFWIGVLISAAFLFFAMRGLDLGEFWMAISTAQYLWLIPGIIVYFAAVWIRAWRWNYLLRSTKSISTSKTFPITCIGYMGNNIYPARAGEVLRAVMLKRKEGVPVSTSLATIIVERIFDGVVMLAFVFLNPSELNRLTGSSGFIGNIRDIAYVGAGVFIIALVTFFFAAIFPKRTLSLSHRLIERIPNESMREKITKVTEKFLNGLDSLRSPRDMFMIFFASLLIWLLETVKYWFVMHAFNFRVTFFTLMLLNGIANLVTTIPSAPGYVGTWEAVTKAVLMAYRVPGPEAFGYAVVLHIALYVPITLLGAFFLAREGIKWNESLRSETILTTRI